MTQQVLSGIKVLDLSRVLAGPWCTQALADMGATVYKIERLGVGDEMRHSPPFLKTREGDVTKDTPSYICVNRGKESITIDFTKPAGHALLMRLVKQCDVLVENFKVGDLKRYGLDYESLKAINPSLVYCSITGYGQDGPHAHLPGYDPAAASPTSGLRFVFHRPKESGMKMVSTLKGLLTASLLATATLAAPVLAQDSWPSRPISVIVPFPPGGNVDNLARILTHTVSQELGTTIVIENRPGGMAQVGADALIRSRNPGHSFMLSVSAVFTVLPVIRTLPFDIWEEIEPLAGVAGYVPILAVRNDLNVKTLEELIALARSKPGELSYGSVGAGSASHMNGETLKLAAGIDLLHVPFKGSAEALNNLIGGNIDVLLDGIAVNAAKAGQVTPLATLYTSRHAALPDLPLASEAGLDFRVPPPPAFGLFAPKGTPADAKERFAAAMQRAVADPENQKRIIALSLLPEWMPQAEYRKALKEDFDYNKDFLPSIGLTEDPAKAN